MSEVVSRRDVVATVIIGRNEAANLALSIKSVQKVCAKIVYVDSGSIDHSCNIAEALGVLVVQLDGSRKFSAARARNAGAIEACRSYLDIDYIQFLDGDCELFDGWLDNALASLELNRDVSLVCGRRRERYPEKSLYNKLCDIEWNTAVGETKECGGDFCVRRSEFDQVGGFNPDLIAGEEPELCLRLRMKGGKIFRLDYDMSLHDAKIYRFGQWWNRAVRSGHAYASGAAMYPKDKGFRWRNSCARIWFWAGVFPSMIFSLSFVNINALYLLFVYPLQVIRIAQREKGVIDSRALYASFVTLAKFPQLQGQLTYWFRRLFVKQQVLIEYK